MKAYVLFCAAIISLFALSDMGAEPPLGYPHSQAPQGYGKPLPRQMGNYEIDETLATQAETLPVKYLLAVLEDRDNGAIDDLITTGTLKDGWKARERPTLRKHRQ